MPLPKNYFHDKLVLLMLSVSAFLTLLGSLLIVFRVAGGAGANNYIVQYRANLGISAYKTGGASSLLAFIIFFVFVASLHWVLSMRIYHFRRYLAVTVLALGILLLVISIVVSNALLVLH
jgi:hypothetical protein